MRRSRGYIRTTIGCPIGRARRVIPKSASWQRCTMRSSAPRRAAAMPCSPPTSMPSTPNSRAPTSMCAFSRRKVASSTTEIPRSGRVRRFLVWWRCCCGPRSRSSSAPTPSSRDSGQSRHSLARCPPRSPSRCPPSGLIVRPAKPVRSRRSCAASCDCGATSITSQLPSVSR